MNELAKLKSTITQELQKLKPMLAQFLKGFKDIEGNNYRLGQTHLERGNLQDAAMRFLFVTRMNPKHVDAWAGLAKALIKKGERAKATSALQSLKRLNPSHADIAAIEAALAPVNA